MQSNSSIAQHYSQHLVVVVSENAALLLCGIQTADVKDSVMAVQVWNQWVLRQRK